MQGTICIIKTTNNLSVTRKKPHFHITKQQAEITKQKPKFCPERNDNSIFPFPSKYSVRLHLSLLLGIGPHDSCEQRSQCRGYTGYP